MDDYEKLSKRQLIERLVNSSRAVSSAQREAGEARRLVQRLQAHQAALERQNQALRMNEIRLQTLLDTVIDGIVTIDPNGRVQSFNPAAERIFGYRAAEVIGNDVSMLMPTPHSGRHQSYVERYLHTGVARVIGIGRELTGQRKDGATFPMELAVSEMRLDGELLFVGIVRDISEREQLQRRMLEIQAELAHVTRLSMAGEMASGLAHELNQPLTAIVTYTQICLHMLKSVAGVPDKLSVTLEKAANQGKRAGEIVRRLRTVVRRSATMRSTVDINGLVEDIAPLADIEARQGGVEMRLKLGDALPPVHVDGVLIQQVLLNLMRNAIEAMVNSGAGRRELIVTTQVAGDDTVEIAVADTGPGLGCQTSESLLRPFFTTKDTELGLGLSTSRSILEAHGGRLWATPNRGPGVTFHFNLPIARGGCHGNA